MDSALKPPSTEFPSHLPPDSPPRAQACSLSLRKEVRKEKGGHIDGDEGDFTLGGEYTMLYTYDVSLNYTLEIYVVLLTSVTPIDVIKKERKQEA